MDIDTLVARFPRLWHATYPQGWEGIRRSGLRTTSDLLGAAGREGEAKVRRDEALVVTLPDGEATIRAQVMNRKDPGPEIDGLTLTDWWALTNGRSYLFAVREDLDKFVDGCLEAGIAQEVITFDTRRLLGPVADQVEVTTVGTGAYPRTTGPSQGRGAFHPLADFTALWSRVKEVTVTVTVAVPENAVVSVVNRLPGQDPARIFPAPRQ